MKTPIFCVLGIVFLVISSPFKSRAQNRIDDPKMYKALRWRPIGPYRAGRASAVAGVIGHPYTYYFGAAGGGVWKTLNGGKDWENVSDGFFKTSGVGAIAVAPSDPKVVYVGMGETNIRGNITPGDGVYKSTDGGQTWTNIGLDQTHFISTIVVDPKNPDIVMVAALGHVFGDNSERGIYRSTDGGKTWDKVLYKDDKTGAIDLVMDPSNPRVLYAALWQAYRNPWSLSSGGPGSGIYKSTDEGKTWTELSSNPGLPKGILGKIGLAVSYQNADKVFAIIEAKHGGIYRSNDAGQSWKLLNDEHELTLRPWYYSKIYVNPDDDNKLYVLDEGFHNSIDGGKEFKEVSTPHGDNHTMWINPHNGKIMIESNDGGANVSYDGGKTWTEQDQNTAQFYHVNLDNRFPYQVYGAQQDLDAITIKSSTMGYAITDKDWYSVAGGESGYVVPKPGAPWITFGGGYEGELQRYNEKTGESYAVSPWPVDQDGEGAFQQKYRFKWTFPITFSSFDQNVLYIGSQYVMKSIDEGHSWKVISPDLTRNDKSKQQPSGGPITRDETGTENYDTIFSLAESPVKRGVIWAGSDDGLIHLTVDGGETWKDVTPDHLPDWTLVSIIEPSSFDAGTAYVAANRYMKDDMHPYLYKTNDYGKHWEKITTGLPEDVFTRVIREDPVRKGLLYAGTERGVWVSFDDGEQWQPLQENLPVVSVRDIRIQKRENDLVIATHGRGFWILDHLKPLRQVSDQLQQSEVHLFEPEHAYLMSGGSYSRPGMTVGQNPPNGAVLFYTLKQSVESLRLTIQTASGDTVRTFAKDKKENSNFYQDKGTGYGSLPDEVGMNRFEWDLRYPDVTKTKGIASGTFYSGKGPRVAPGTYTVTLQSGTRSMSQELKVVPNPNNPASDADFAARQELLMKIYHDLDKTNKTVNHIESIRDQINDYLANLNEFAGVDELQSVAEPMKDSLNAIESGLIQKHIETDEDVLRYPVQLHTKLGALRPKVESSYARPTKAMRSTYQMLDERLVNLLKRLDAVIKTDIPKFNRKVDSLQVPNPVYLNPGDN
ncbi:MAG: glycosyl hydrolase [Balneolaceae bacterium]